MQQLPGQTRARSSTRAMSLALALLSCGPIVGAVWGVEPASPAAPSPAPARAPAPTDGEASANDRRPDPINLSAQAEGVRAAHGVPAIAIVVVRREGDVARVIARGASGLRSRDAEARVTLDDRWHIGSCGKAITATLCAMLVDEGLLKWETTIAEVFPTLAPRMNPVFASITLEQLLTNRAGLPGDLLADGLWGKLWAQNGEASESGQDGRRVLLEGLMTRPPSPAPGKGFVYSNAGFAIAGHMAETRAGMAYERLVRARLFEPLVMSSAGFGAPGRASALDQPRGHTPMGEPVEPGPSADNPRAIAPAGTMHMSLEDWAKFVAVHLDPAPGTAAAHEAPAAPEGERASVWPGIKLSPASVERLRRPAVAGDPTPYAMGWLATRRGWAGPDGKSMGVALTHSGSNTMWYAVVWAAPERGLAFVAATNSGVASGPKALDALVAAALKVVDAAPTRRAAPEAPVAPAHAPKPETPTYSQPSDSPTAPGAPGAPGAPTQPRP